MGALGIRKRIRRDIFLAKIDHLIPLKPPVGQDGTEWIWRGSDAPGGERGAWVNPQDRNESIHPDLDYPAGIPPHWDYNKNKESIRVIDD